MKPYFLEIREMHRTLLAVSLASAAAAATVMPAAAHAHIVVVESAAKQLAYIQTSEPGEESADLVIDRALQMCREMAQSKDCRLKISKVSGLAVIALGDKGSRNAKGDPFVYGRYAFGTDAAAVRKAALANCARVAPAKSCRPVFVTWSGEPGESKPEAVQALQAEALANFTTHLEDLKKQLADILPSTRR